MVESNDTKVAKTSEDSTDSLETPYRYLAYASRLARFSRYLAFTSDIGEAIRPVVNPTLVKATYGISFGYCLVDIGWEGRKAWVNTNKNQTLVGRVVLERTLFQGLASLLLPAITIHTIVDLSAKHIFAGMKTGSFGRRFGPSGVGLAFLPAIPFLFDEPVEHGMEFAFDKVWPLSADEIKSLGKQHHE